MLKLKFEYIPSFVIAFLACKSFKALIYISVKVLAIKGSLALLVLMLFASFNAKVIIVLKFRRLIIISGLLYKN